MLTIVWKIDMVTLECPLEICQEPIKVCFAILSPKPSALF